MLALSWKIFENCFFRDLESLAIKCFHFWKMLENSAKLFVRTLSPVMPSVTEVIRDTALHHCCNFLLLA